LRVLQSAASPALLADRTGNRAERPDDRQQQEGTRHSRCSGHSAKSTAADLCHTVVIVGTGGIIGLGLPAVRLGMEAARHA